MKNVIFKSLSSLVLLYVLCCNLSFVLSVLDLLGLSSSGSPLLPSYAALFQVTNFKCVGRFYFYMLGQCNMCDLCLRSKLGKDLKIKACQFSFLDWNQCWSVITNSHVLLSIETFHHARLVLAHTDQDPLLKGVCPRFCSSWNI